MAKIRKKTITIRGIEKNVDRFVESLKNAGYVLDGIEKKIEFLKVDKTEDSVKIYLYFDDGVVGTISNIRIFDTDDEVIIQTDDIFTKERYKGFYIMLEYKFVEEVE